MNYVALTDDEKMEVYYMYQSVRKVLAFLCVLNVVDRYTDYRTMYNFSNNIYIRNIDAHRGLR